MIMILAFLFPLAAGIIASAVKMGDRARKGLYAAIMLLTDVLCVPLLMKGGEITLMCFAENVTLTFRLDGIGRLFLGAVLLLYTAVCFYAFEYLEDDRRMNVFFAFLFASLGAMLSVCAAGNLVTVYLCFELATLTSMPLVLHELTKEAIAAALKYLFYSVAGALLGLLAVFFVYRFTSGPADFAAGGFLDPQKTAGNEQLLRAMVLAGIIGFGTKAGMYPMHGWLPSAHPIAPAPASALLSGIIAKAGVLAVIRLVYSSVGTHYLAGTWVQTVWMCLAMLTVFMGSMMAFREKITKKRLAYSTISQISYIMLSLSLMTDAGLQGGLLHVLGHVAAKGCLFLCAGVFIHKLHRTRVDELRGVGLQMPVTLSCFAVASLSLVGIPPLAGYLSKWVIAGAAIDSAPGVFAILAPVVLLISALLTAGYLLPVVVNGFFPGRDFDTASLQKAEPSALMLVPLVLLCCAVLAVGLFGTALVGGVL